MERALREVLRGGVFGPVPTSRRAIMRRIRSRGTKSTERTFRMALVRHRISGWKLHSKDLPGRPDVYFLKRRIAIFLDGCFWHGCPSCGHIPKRNRNFWSLKIELNRKRDRRSVKLLREQAIQVMRIWEHEIVRSKRLKRIILEISQLLDQP
jgi:DNA mismatch endonuclease (patch repair protein)